MVQIGHTPVNGYSSTLNGAVNDSTTTWTVTSATGLPTDAQFYLYCNDEIVLVTDISGASLTVERGAIGTTAKAHDDLAVIESLFTSQELLKIINQQAQWGRGGHNYTAYGRIRHGTTILTESDFTQDNGGTKADGVNGVLILRPPKHTSNDNEVSGMKYSVGSGLFTATAHIGSPFYDGSHGASEGDVWGLYVKQDSGSALRCCVLGRTNATLHVRVLMAQSMTSTTATPTILLSSNVTGRHDYWFRIQRKSGNLWDLSFSADGVNFMDFVTDHSWDPGGAVSVGPYMNSNLITNAECHVFALEIEDD